MHLHPMTAIVLCLRLDGRLGFLLRGERPPTAPSPGVLSRLPLLLHALVEHRLLPLFSLSRPDHQPPLTHAP